MAKRLPKWARVRQLIDGSYVAEVRTRVFFCSFWEGICEVGMKWQPGHMNYRDCMCKSAEEAIGRLAKYGVSLIDDGKPEPTQEISKSPDAAREWNGYYTAFITGSHFYGKPTADSDIDLAIMCCPETEKKLKELSDSKSFPIRFGNLNLVTLKTPSEYDAWLAARQRIAEMPAHTKEDRIAIHKEELAWRGCEHKKDVSS